MTRYASTADLIFQRANRPLLRLAALAFLLAAGGCSGGDQGPSTSTKTETQGGDTSQTNTKPEALCRANYLRLDLDLPEAELRGIFGPPQQVSQESKDTRKYTWTSGKTKLDVQVRGGKVVASTYPGEYEERQKRAAAQQAAQGLIETLRAYVLKNKNRFPQRPEDLGLADLVKRHPEVGEAVKRGDVVVPWGKSANRLVWAYWKDTPQFGGPTIRFDGKAFSKCTPQEFARMDAVVLTANTIPADIAAQSKPGRGEPAHVAGREKKGIGSQGFFTSAELARLLVSQPGSLDEVAKHLVRNYWDVEILRMLEKGELIVRWGRDPKQGVYAYPRDFPQVGDPAGWAIYKGQWAPFERLDEAKKAFAE